MPSTTQQMVRELLREAGPLSIAEILARVPDWKPTLSKDRRGAMGNAVRNDELVENRGDGRYVYLPTRVNGAAVRVPVWTTGEQPRHLSVGVEVAALLCLTDKEPGPATPRLALEGGPTVGLTLERWQGQQPGYWEGRARRLTPEAGFWPWWADRQRDGADAVVMRCDDYEAGRFRASAVRTADLDRDAVAAANDRLLKTAVAAMKNTQGMTPEELARRLLARGAYHGEPAPDPLFSVLFSPTSPFIVEMGYRLVYRPELTPAIRLVLADRLDRERAGGRFAGLFDFFGGLAASFEDEEPAEAPEPREAPPATTVYRIKVSPTWESGRVWRTIEVLDNETLEELHEIIQDAFGWDDEHLFAFYLSGRFDDQLTEIGRWTGERFDEQPTADQVFVGELGLQPGQRLAYRYNFFHDLDHRLEVLETRPFAGNDAFPRVIDERGEAVERIDPEGLAVEMMLLDDPGWALGELDEGAPP